MIDRRLFLASSSAGLLLAAPVRARAQSPTRLKISITPTIFPEMFDGMVEAFEMANPDVKITIEGKHRSQENQFQETLRLGLIGDLPDLSFQGFAYLPVLKANGYSVPLDARLASEPKAAELGLADAVIKPNIVDGELHALSVGMSFPIVYVNMALAGKVGVKEADLPKDWPGILDLAGKIGGLGGDIQGGYIQYASGDNWIWVALVESLGARMMTADGRLGFLGAEGRKSLEIIRSFGEIGQARYDTGQDQSRRAFASGLLGVLFDSSSSLASFEKTAGDRFAIRTIPAPLGPDGWLPAAGIATVMHTRDPAKQDAAWRFMLFASSPGGQVLVGKLTGYTPPNRIALEAPDLLGRYYAERPSYSAGLASARHAARWFVFPGENGQKAHLEVKEHLGRIATLKATPEEGMAAIEKTVRALVPGVKG